MPAAIYNFEIAYGDAAAWFAPHADKPYALWLDSHLPTHPLSRYSYILPAPVDVLSVKNDAKTFARLAAFINPHLSNQSAPFPFAGGAAGILSYELAHQLETLTPPAADEWGLPDMAMGLYQHGLCFDHYEKKAYGFYQTPAQKREIEDWQEDVLTARLPALDMINSTAYQGNFAKGDYLAAISEVIEHILAGDIFQANLAQQFRARINESGFDFYRHAREISPAPFSAFMNLGDMQIASLSPERFLFCHKGHVEARPIKGTAPRHPAPEADQMAAETLLHSEKDRAENIMIVDLMRNDLARVCVPHSIHVPEICAIESFSHVHHLVSCVKGQLADDKTMVDLLAACFPAGSITGAPKIRAMDIITAKEPSRRGIYCGAIGYIGFNGVMDMNVAIRTALIKNQQVYFYGGGGITAQSDPACEYQETFDKTAGLHKAIGG